MDRIERDRLRKMFSSKRSRHRDKWKFDTADDLITWWGKRLDEQQDQCEYCGTKLSTIQHLIEQKKIGVRRANKTGSRNRFELERINPEGDYSRDNCALACYYCNNDKSNVYTDIASYKQFIGAARKKYFEWLLGRT